jgi:hypothetical protein
VTGDGKRGYGHAREVFISRKPASDSWIVGGSAEDGHRFARVVTTGAVRVLWFHLTRHLYPELAAEVTALVPTAPLRSVDLPAITSHVAVVKNLDGAYLVTGTGGREEWLLCLYPAEAQDLWRLLDKALHPVGW